jgi:predicted nucleic acid-binding protein
VAEQWVLNASPLIVLGRIDQDRLLLELADQIVIPQSVAKEIRAGPAEDRARLALDEGIFRVIDTPPAPPELLAWDLGAGETAVLSFVMANPGWTAVIDDAAARKCAQSFSLPVKGTLGIILLAKKQGRIASAAELLKSVRAAGFRLDDRIIRRALHAAGDWQPDGERVYDPVSPSHSRCWSVDPGPG